MNSTMFTSPLETIMLAIGLMAMLYGAFRIWENRGRPGRLIAWGGLIDFGLALMGFGLGPSGDVGSLLILVYHGAARIAAWMGLAGLVAEPWTCTIDDIRGAVQRNPVGAILLAFALEASLGISPALSPEGQHLVLHAMAAHSVDSPLGGPLLALLMASIYTLLLWLSAEVVLHVCFTRPDEAEEAFFPHRPAASDRFDPASIPGGTWCPLAVRRWATCPSALTLYTLLALLVLLGVGRHLCQKLAAWVVGVPPAELIVLEGPWAWGALALYFGSFPALCPHIVRPRWRTRYAAGVMLAALALTLLEPLPPLARFFGIIIAGIGCLVVWYSSGYIENDERRPWYWFFLLLTFGSLLAIVTTTNIGTFTNLWEIMTWASFALVAWERTAQARKAALKYVALCGGAAYLMVVGLFMLGGEASFYGDILAGAGSRPAEVLRFALVFILLGFMAKAGLAPLHGWLPDAHPAAPSSVSAPLSGVLTKMGVFGIVLTYALLVGLPELHALGTIGGLTVPGLLVTLTGLSTMCIGELAALRQTDLKRMLAYSTMGQVGEIVTVLGIGTWLSLTGALAHTLNHAVMKDLLFLGAGALIFRAGSRELADLAGLGRRMPWTTVCMSIGIIAIMGLPPFNGFISKYLMIAACMDAGQPLIAAALIVASLVGAVYYMRILRTLLLDPEPAGRPPVTEAPLSMRAPLAVLAGLCVLFGIAPQSGLSLVTPVADALAAAGAPAGEWGTGELPELAVSWPCYVILPMIGAILPVIFRNDPRRAGRIAAGVLAASALLVILFGRQLDTLSFWMTLLVPGLGALNMVYAVGYMEHSRDQWRFHAFFLLMCGGLAGAAASTDLFGFFMFWEIMSSWTLYFVIAHEGSPEALREGFKYFMFNVAGAGCLFLGIGIIAGCTGTSRFELVRPMLAALPTEIGTAAFALLAFGFLMKAAQLALRIDWQMHPDLAPTPVSGYISSVLLKIAVFGLVKLFLVFGGASLILPGEADPFHQEAIMRAAAWIGAFTLLYSAVQAMLQVRLKLVFIWSTVSQIGYMVLGVATGSALGMAGGLLHLANHVFFKDLLFLMVGAVMFRTHRDSIHDLGGIGRKMPLTMFCFFVGALAVIGVPPASGFTSKWIIYQALMQEGQPLLALISLIGSVITLAYMARFLHIVFLGQPAGDLDVREAPAVMLAPMLVLVFLVLLSGVFPGIFLRPIVSGLEEYGLPHLAVGWSGISAGAGAWNAPLATLLMLVAFGGVWLALRRALAGVRVRTAPPHACGHDAAVATPMPPDSVYGVLVRTLTANRPQGRDCVLRELARGLREWTRGNGTRRRADQTAGREEGPSC